MQNNIEELFNLMNFLGLEDFEDPKEMAEAYGDLNKEQLEQLHVKLKPYFLRRSREQVLGFLPPKVLFAINGDRKSILGCLVYACIIYYILYLLTNFICSESTLIHIDIYFHT